jgi:hypothetical protein
VNISACPLQFFIGGVKVAGTAAFLDCDIIFKCLRLHVFLISEIGFSVFSEKMHFLMPIFIEIMLKLLWKCCPAVPHLLLGYVQYQKCHPRTSQGNY